MGIVLLIACYSISLFSMERTESYGLTNTIGKEVRSLIDMSIGANAVDALLCELERKYETRNQETMLKCIHPLGVVKGVSFSVAYTGWIWELCTNITFFKGELHNPEKACLAQEKRGLWYTLLQACSSKRGDLFPVVLDTITKLSSVEYAIKTLPSTYYDDEYKATISSMFSSRDQLKSFLIQKHLDSIYIPIDTDCNISVELLKAGKYAVGLGKKEYEGVLLSYAMRRGLTYLVAILSLPCEDWRKPEDYLVAAEKDKLYGKLICAFHNKFYAQLADNQHGPHVCSDVLKGIWRPQDQKLLFEHLINVNLKQ